MAPWLYRCEAADTIYARDENVIGPEAPPGSEHNVLSRWTNARPRKVVAVSVRALCGWEDAEREVRRHLRCHLSGRWYSRIGS